MAGVRSNIGRDDIRVVSSNPNPIESAPANKVTSLAVTPARAKVRASGRSNPRNLDFKP
jgi:hypothetical protein